MSLTVYLGIDVGSVTTKLALVDQTGKYVDSVMLKTAGTPVNAVQTGLQKLYNQKLTDYEVAGVGTTILEIGGQDSKIIIMRDGIVTDFAMNTVCAAGTGSFLDHQAQRLNVPIEEFGPTALKSTNPARIAGRCGVFAESDLIHKQQLGYPVEDLLYGLCQALVRNYLSNLALGKELLPVFSFQGGVASNTGMVKAFEEALNAQVVVPEHHQTMGAIGAAMLAMENHQYTQSQTKFKGWNVADMHFSSITCACNGCSNNCEVITIVEGVDEVQHVEKIKDVKGNIIARWGGTCGRWDIG